MATAPVPIASPRSDERRRLASRNSGFSKAFLFRMPKPPDYLQYARECNRLALEAREGKDRELLLAMAKAWTELAVEKSAPEPEQSAAP